MAPQVIARQAAAKTNVVLRLVDGDGKEVHATRLVVAKAKLGQPLSDLVERFVRHYNRRCDEAERVVAARLEASDAEGPLASTVAVGNLLNPLDPSEQTLRVVLRTAKTDAEVLAEDEAIRAASRAAHAGEDDDGVAPPGEDASKFAPSPTFKGYREGMVFKKGYHGVGYYEDALVAAGVALEKLHEEDRAAFEGAAAFGGERAGFVFTTRELGTGYYRDRPPPKYDPHAADLAMRGAVVLRGYDLPPPNGMLFSKAEFDKIRIAAAPETVLVIFFEKCREDGGGSAKIAPMYKKMGNQFWPRAVLLRADVDDARDLADACSVTTAPTFVFFKNAKPVDKCQGACEMAINVKIVKALKHGVQKKRHAWGDGLIKKKK